MYQLTYFDNWNKAPQLKWNAGIASLIMAVECLYDEFPEGRPKTVDAVRQLILNDSACDISRD